MRPMLLLAAALVIGSGLATAAQDAAPSAPAARLKAPHGATVSILSPKDGATVGQDVNVKFGVEGIALTPAGDPMPGSGHHHLLIDAKELPPLDAPIPNDATHKHYGKGQTEDTVRLTPGDHTLQLDFADAAHMQFDPPLVSKKIKVHVK